MESKINKGKEILMEKLNVPRVVVTGNKEITIENHKGILSFDLKEIKVNSTIGVIKVQGDNFEILYIGGDTITISGRFKAVMYEGALD